MKEQNNQTNNHNLKPEGRDELDQLLRLWHRQNAEQATAARDRLIEKLHDADLTGRENEPADENIRELNLPDDIQEGGETKVTGSAAGPTRRLLLRRLIMNRYSPVAAALILLAVLLPFMTTTPASQTRADTIMVPEGGRLDALDKEGNILGPCPLKHTDVNVEISGPFTRVTLKQTYYNQYADKIEAVYTFPMSQRSAVDRMTMTVGDRVIVGEIHERAIARMIYEQARQSGYVASLLEQERPNIFTQSVANIEPGAQIDIEISYVELLESKDGQYSFAFPMVVGPRYIPGSMPTAAGDLPEGLTGRQGVILLGPAQLNIVQEGEVKELGTLQVSKLTALIHNAVPTTAKPLCPNPTVWYRFEAVYCNQSKEIGELYTDGTGQINGRWFYTDPKAAKEQATGFTPNTDQVPDASKITPMPVKPGQRAGHDIDIKVTIDTGGPGIVDLKSVLHELKTTERITRDDGLPRKMTLALAKADEIPNRDFVLNWRQTADTITEATFTHTGRLGNYFTLILQPPERVDNAQAVARELIFVLDTSGSMSGFPIEKAKAVMAKAIDSLRPQDTFNLITFSGDTRILWNKPRPFTEANRKEAQNFLANRRGGGGTEMMKAIHAALVQTLPGTCDALSPWQLMNLPADGRKVTISTKTGEKADPMIRHSIPIGSELQKSDKLQLLSGLRSDLRDTGMEWETIDKTLVTGRWETQNGERVFVLEKIDFGVGSNVNPIRVVCFMTDGYVGNDMAIIDAIQKNARTTRVFSFGIGDSVNRYLLDGMARAGRGEVEYVLLADDADAAVERFTKRIQTPVLTDIELTFSSDLEISERIPAQLPDLFDVKPLIIHGKYTHSGKGTLTIRGNTAAGHYERTLNLELPEKQPAHDVIATLWARSKVEDLMNIDLAAAQQGRFPEELKQEVITLGQQYNIMTAFTSFVAVEKARVTIGGQPRLVAVPIEMPQGVSYEGIFGPVGADVAVLTEVDSPTEAEEKAGSPVRYAKAEEMAELLKKMVQDRSANSAQRIEYFYAPAQSAEGKTSCLKEQSNVTGALTLYSNRKANQPLTIGGPDSTETSILGRPGLQRGYGGMGGMGMMGDGYGGMDKMDDGRTSGRLRGEMRYLTEFVPTAPPPPPANMRPVDRPENTPQPTTNVGGTIESDAQTDTAGKSEPAPDLADSLKRIKDKGTATRLLIPERVALEIAKLVSDGKIDEAKKLADALVEFDAKFEIGRQMRDVLADTSLKPEEVKTRIAALAAQARKPIDAVLKDAKLQRRLDPRLYALATDEKAAPADLKLPITDGRLSVTLLTSDKSEATITLLKNAGLRIESVAASMNVIVGAVSREKLADLALLDPVRKIEPMKE